MRQILFYKQKLKMKYKRFHHFEIVHSSICLNKYISHIQSKSNLNFICKVLIKSILRLIKIDYEKYWHDNLSLFSILSSIEIIGNCQVGKKIYRTGKFVRFVWKFVQFFQKFCTIWWNLFFRNFLLVYYNYQLSEINWKILPTV